MNKIQRLLFGPLAAALGLAASLVHAQEGPLKQDPPPAMPVLPASPKFASWQITYTYPNDKQKPDTLPADAAPAIPGEFLPQFGAPRRLVVTRTRPAWAAEMNTVDGKTVRQWSDGSNRFVQISGMASPINISANVTEVVDYSQGDFPALEWISATNYCGVQAAKGEPCYVFRQNDQVAWISVANHFPVMSQAGAQRAEYLQLPPPAAMLSYPPEVQQIIDAISKDQAWLSRRR
jgi:hypothetical protein